MNRVRKEQLRERMDKLEPEEHAQIFEVIRRYTQDYTRTQNRVLVSSDALPDECLIEIEKMVTYYGDQKKRMDADNIERKAISRM